MRRRWKKIHYRMAMRVVKVMRTVVAVPVSSPVVVLAVVPIPSLPLPPPLPPPRGVVVLVDSLPPLLLLGTGAALLPLALSPALPS